MDYLIRFLFCLFKSALAIAIVLALCVGGFVMAMNVSNIYILMSDGMAMRTSVVLGLSDPEELPKFFSESCIQSDAIYQDTTYVDYDMDSFESEVTLLSMHTLPWEDTATVTLLQEVPSVVGYLPISKQTPEQLADPNKIPAPAGSPEAMPWSCKRWRISGRSSPSSSWKPRSRKSRRKAQREA